MSVSLAVVTEEAFEALQCWDAVGAGPTESPFTKSSGCKTFFGEQFADRDLVRRNRLLPFWLHTFVIANERVAGMFSRHQNTPRRRANGVARIVLSESHSLLGKFVEIRRLNLLLAKTPEFAVTQIIGHDQNDIGSPISSVQNVAREECEQQNG